VKLDYAANAVPMTYQGKNGIQYVAVMSGGAASSGAAPNNQGLIVFSFAVGPLFTAEMGQAAVRRVFPFDDKQENHHQS
jgi:hypothetical protein